ncbi:MAG: TetR/AcrR family transcriptional regulator, partial [Actinocrinis sp.]
ETPRERLLAIFDALGESVALPTYRGCAFANASAEALPGSATAAAVDEYRDWLHEMLLDLCSQVGAHDSARLAGQLQLIYDGVGLAARQDHDAAVAASNGRSAADALITAATA